MTMIDAIRSCFNKYATFSGRARRSEYWYFYLFLTLAGWAIGIIAMVILIFQAVSGSFGDIENSDNVLETALRIYTSPGMCIFYIWSLGTLLPQYAVLVRRLHDVGKSGWFYLFYLITIVILYLTGIGLIGYGIGCESWSTTGIGALMLLAILGLSIYLLVLLCTDSQRGPNKYGPNPKGIGNEEPADAL